MRPQSVRAKLTDRARRFTDGAARKVRLLFDGERNGELQIGEEILPAHDGAELVLRVRMARENTYSADRWLYHKTTQRPLYALAYKQAVAAGYEDVLFRNERGEVTEGAINNIFIEKDGRWFTPPVECGLLAGVYRRHLMETRPGIEERVLFLDDLKQSDAIYLTNAVRGLRTAILDRV